MEKKMYFETLEEADKALQEYVDKNVPHAVHIDEFAQQLVDKMEEESEDLLSYEKAMSLSPIVLSSNS